MGRRPAAPIMAACPASRHLGPIVVGVERSERSRDAVALGRTLARAVGARADPGRRLPRRRPLGGDAAGRLRRRAGGGGRSHARVGRAPARRRRRERAGGAVHLRGTRPAGRSRRRRRARDRRRPVPPRRARAGRARAASASACCTARRAPSPSRRAATGRTPPGPIRRIGVGFVATPEADEALGAAVGIAAADRRGDTRLSVVEPPSARRRDDVRPGATTSSSRPRATTCSRA